jgi:hypothetical protein
MSATALHTRRPTSSRWTSAPRSTVNTASRFKRSDAAVPLDRASPAARSAGAANAPNRAITARRTQAQRGSGRAPPAINASPAAPRRAGPRS